MANGDSIMTVSTKRKESFSGKEKYAFKLTGL